MSIRIVLDNQPEFYTNLDIIRGQVILSLNRHEQVGAIIAKLEGESRTALAIPTSNPYNHTGRVIAPRDRDDSFGQNGSIMHENHKILYKVAQVFPDEQHANQPPPFVLAPGQHRFPFQFKFPFNNACSDPEAMAKLGGLAGSGGFGSGSSFFGLSGGIRVMDGTRQLMYSHVTKTLPPSFTGFPGEAEIRYYVKVTVQRPGIFKENWRYQAGLKFMPIEPPKPPKTNQEAYVRRPFTFQPRTPRNVSPGPALQPKAARSSFFFGGGRSSSTPQIPTEGASKPEAPASPPSIEMSARLPQPPILTCNKPVPLRLIAKKLVPSNAEVYLIAVQIDLVGQTHVRCQDLITTENTRWVIMSRQGLSIPVSRPEDPVGTETPIPGESLWGSINLPNTVMPSFITCNLSRDYQLEVKLGLSWGKPSSSATNSAAGSSSLFGGKGKSRMDLSEIPQEIHLPLHFSTVDVYSGLAPPEQLVEAMRQGRKTRPNRTQSQSQTPAQPPRPQPPNLPPRPSQQQVPQQQQQTQQQVYDPLYPPQLQPGQAAPPYDDAPPSYDEAMAEEMTGPILPQNARPAYSGVTNENEPSTLPEKH
ncbi:hypothetical protein QBC46DRAFT_77276 [Diplogelasinospora grovesii]|uniref:Arrestin-like N-terminal domain-containing protein n=1 Tax=Diplogelasinospora grovesii TaxID=303347 RepID=A0AAN6NDI0_9PEZI|nr:hypothetical protein QBC46DRAFT_77276 [Diplogelasinospora grovesii]